MGYIKISVITDVVIDITAVAPADCDDEAKMSGVNSRSVGVEGAAEMVGTCKACQLLTLALADRRD